MSIFQTVEKLFNSGVKASTIIQRLRKDKNFAKPMAKAIGYGYTPDMIVDRIMSMGERQVEAGATPEIRAAQERGGIVQPEFAEKSKRFAKGAAKLAGTALAATQIPRAIGAAAAGLEALGSAAQPEEAQAEEAQPEASDMMAKAEKLPTKEEMETTETSPKVEPERFLQDFPQLDDYTRKQLKQGKSPTAIYMLLKGAKAFAGLVERYESGGQSYFTRIRELVDEMGGGKKQKREPKDLLGKAMKNQARQSADDAELKAFLSAVEGFRR